ncbi:hypothetical protein Bbelb_425640 [Branchiostoma belcheri]|nr:hypothetical protein Bbelb_425640 [Branchiostoma belcheri]
MPTSPTTIHKRPRSRPPPKYLRQSVEPSRPASASQRQRHFLACSGATPSSLNPHDRMFGTDFKPGTLPRNHRLEKVPVCLAMYASRMEMVFPPDICLESLVLACHVYDECGNKMFLIRGVHMDVHHPPKAGVLPYPRRICRGIALPCENEESYACWLKALSYVGS